MTCLRCNGSGKERKRPNYPALGCFWCEGSGFEPGYPREEDRRRRPLILEAKARRPGAVQYCATQPIRCGYIEVGKLGIGWDCGHNHRGEQDAKGCAQAALALLVKVGWAVRSRASGMTWWKAEGILPLEEGR